MWQFPDDPTRRTVIHIFGGDASYFYCGKKLPAVAGVASLFRDYKQIRLALDDGRRITLHETEQDFPSDKLLAQVMLVGG